MKVTIITLNWNGKRILGDLLDEHIRSLLETDYENFEVIFADNGSSDGSPDYVEAHFKNPKLRILRMAKNYGYSRGNNLAFKEVDPATEIVVFINNDTIVDKTWLKELVKGFSNPDVVIAQPLLMSMETGRIQFVGGFVDEYGRSMTVSGEYDERINNILIGLIKKLKFSALSVLWAYGACIAVKKGFFEKIGGFNELFFPGLEEQTLCIPAHSLGYKTIVVPRSIVWHRSGATIKHLQKRRREIRETLSRLLFVLIYVSDLKMLIKGLIGRIILEFLISLKTFNPLAFFWTLYWLFRNPGTILRLRRRAYKLASDSPYIVKSPLLSRRYHHVALALTKLLEVNK
ncbi:MAG: glycosyltransferase family 2 protein [Metallosphaera sp.]